MPSKKRKAPSKKPAKKAAPARAKRGQNDKKKSVARAKSAAARKAAPAKKVPAKKAPPKKAIAKKAAPKKAVAKKATTKVVAKKAAAAKPAAKKKAAAARKPAKASAPKPKAAEVRRRDGGGHIDPTYAQGLLDQSGGREPQEAAFVDGSEVEDDLAEEMGEEFVETATTGEHEAEDVADEVTPEERGGPFVVTTGGTEFADGVDPSNPPDAEREPFPKT